MGLKIGRILEQAREERGLSLHQVEQATKIRAKYLKELERENFDVLPAVYVQGSLRTYADYLGLDSEALVRELKFRQASRDEPQRRAYAELPKGGAAGSVVPGIGLSGAETRTKPEDKWYVAPTLSDGGNNLLYLGAAALLIIVLALVAFASTLAAPGQPRISQVREPLASRVPDSGGGGELANLPWPEGNAPNAGEEDDGRPSKHESSDGDAGEEDSGRQEQTEESQQDPAGAQDAYAASTVQPSIATATPTATTTAGATQSTVPPIEPPPEPPQEEPPTAEAPAPEPAASPPRADSPGRRVMAAPMRTLPRGPVVVRRSTLPGRQPAVIGPRRPVATR